VDDIRMPSKNVDGIISDTPLIEEPGVYTVPEIQKILGVSKNTAYQLVKSKLFETRTLGKKILISRKSFERWLNGEKEK
jgi:excisionase family DNA binding protein